MSKSEERAWMALRTLLASEVDDMAWRLSALTPQDVDDFLTELTDRLISKVHPRD